MPTTKANIKVQVNRLMGLKGQDPSGFGDEMVQSMRAEFGRTLERYCSSDEEAYRVTDWLIFQRPEDQRIFRPAPGEIPDAVREVRQAAEREQDTPEGCPECEGHPWVTVQKTVIDSYTGQPMLREGSRRCYCSRGQWFRSKDAERRNVAK